MKKIVIALFPRRLSLRYAGVCTGWILCGTRRVRCAGRSPYAITRAACLL